MNIYKFSVRHTGLSEPGYYVYNPAFEEIPCPPQHEKYLIVWRSLCLRESVSKSHVLTTGILQPIESNLK